MLKVSHTTLIILSGAVWMGVGLWLLPLGLKLFLATLQQSAWIESSSLPLIGFLSPYLGGKEETVVVLVALGLCIGFLKGRYVLGKAAKKGVERIKAFSNPTALLNLYSPKYLLLLGGMILLGMSMRFLGLPNDIRGFIDVAIGSALINGSMIYFRSAYVKNN